MPSIAAGHSLTPAAARLDEVAGGHVSEAAGTAAHLKRVGPLPLRAPRDCRPWAAPGRLAPAWQSVTGRRRSPESEGRGRRPRRHHSERHFDARRRPGHAHRPPRRRSPASSRPALTCPRRWRRGERGPPLRRSTPAPASPLSITKIPRAMTEGVGARRRQTRRLALRARSAVANPTGVGTVLMIVVTDARLHILSSGPCCCSAVSTGEAARRCHPPSDRHRWLLVRDGHCGRSAERTSPAPRCRPGDARRACCCRGTPSRLERFGVVHIRGG